LASKALREHEKELKDILFYSGNAPVWEEMMAERTRLTKERNTLEREEAERKQKDKEAKVAIIMNTLWISGASAIIVPLVSIAFHVITNRGF
jgi:chromosome segregation and condensation protein ScpB